MAVTKKKPSSKTRQLSVREIVGYSEAHHKIICDDSNTTVLRSKKVHKTENDSTRDRWDKSRGVQDRLSDTNSRVVIGYNKAGKLEVHWWTTEVVIEE